MTLTQTPFLGKLTTDGATLLWAQGYRPRDRVFLPFGYNVFAAFWAGHYACGRTYSLLRGGVFGRADDITKVKGVLLAPAAIEDVVRSIPGLGDEYEVVVEKKGDIDQITLKVEVAEDTPITVEELEGRLTTELRFKTNLGYYIQIHPYGTLPRYEVKATRFKDLRKKKDR